MMFSFFVAYKTTAFYIWQFNYLFLLANLSKGMGGKNENWF